MDHISLALLWFYTFGSQMLKYEDGYTSDQAAAAGSLIAENERQYPNSSIFLFFRGRVERMKVGRTLFKRINYLKLMFQFSYSGKYLGRCPSVSTGLPAFGPKGTAFAVPSRDCLVQTYSVGF